MATEFSTIRVGNDLVFYKSIISLVVNNDDTELTVTYNKYFLSNKQNGDRIEIKTITKVIPIDTFLEYNSCFSELLTKQSI